MIQHPYCYPGTDTYRNKENIRNRGELEEVERVLTLDRLTSLPDDISIDAAGYRAIHKHLFGRLYDWAGKYRTIDTGRTGPFCKADFIVPEMEKRFAAIDDDAVLHSGSSAAFAMGVAIHVGELNAIHPFLDGNGRCLRALLERIAARAGHSIDLARIDARAWNHASIVSFHKLDYSLLRDVIYDALISKA